MIVECPKWKTEETKPASACVQEEYRTWGSVSMNRVNISIANQLMRWTCLDAWKAFCLGWEKEELWGSVELGSEHLVAQKWLYQCHTGVQ